VNSSPFFSTDLLAGHADFSERLAQVFGNPHDDVLEVVRRAAQVFPGLPVIVWEGDPQTFQFSYVSPSAREVLGYPCENWLNDPAFWANTVIHPDDKMDAVAYCALATGKGQDHDFQYRARASDGRIVLLHDVVHVIKSARGLASRLRGIMIPVSSTPPQPI
jgi:PAS domain-containing protein